jgi:hypothetical protein
MTIFAQAKFSASGSSVSDVIEQLYALAGAAAKTPNITVVGTLAIDVHTPAQGTAAVASPVTPAGPSPAVPPAAEAPKAAVPPSTAPTSAASPGTTVPVTPPDAATAAPKRRGRPPGSGGSKPTFPIPTPPVMPEGAQSPPPAVAVPASPTPAAPAGGPAVAGPTEQDVLASLHALATTGKGSFQLAEMALSRFGARKRSELKPEFYAEFVALAKKGIETGEV